MSSISEIFDLGQQCLNLGNPKDALVHFEKILEIEPNNTEALQKVGNIFGKLGKYEKAITCYDKVLQQNQDNILALINKGLALHYLQKYEEAITCYDKVLKIKPTNLVTLYNKSSTLICQNKIEEGLKILQDVTDKDFSYKAKAKFDIDFQKIKTNNEFKKIVWE